MVLNPLNCNIGLLGHVDSGKTSIARFLSQTQSTACFDKDPQAQSRGITLDLGFSSFSSSVPSQFENIFSSLQYSLVDHPGHASLLRTVIGGSSIIDLMILVIDITKGIQTQTGECIVLGEIMCKPSVVLLNKIDLLPEDSRDSYIQKAKTSISKALNKTKFLSAAPIIPFSTHSPLPDQTTSLLAILESIVLTLPRIQTLTSSDFSNVPCIISIDHCFGVKGKGNVVTGTVLEGVVSLNDELVLSAQQNPVKVKSIQSFKKQVSKAVSGDRVGLCISGLDVSSTELDRFWLTSSRDFPWFKQEIVTGQNYHVSIGFDTVVGRVSLFKASESLFQLSDEVYEILNNYQDAKSQCYALVSLSKPVLVPPSRLAICSRLDFPQSSKQCRIAFYGEVNIIGNNLSLYKTKSKSGVVDRVIDGQNLVMRGMFDSVPQARVFLNETVYVGDCKMTGVIESTFGKSGKVKIRLIDGDSEVSVGDNVELVYRRFLRSKTSTS
ncbi:hypothetical protein GEMRC1_008240 [Eukaryota sp. GEM-RC1]